MIVALQYYEGDQQRAFSLARLLADIEPSPRDDVLLALVCQPDTPPSEAADFTIRYCALKFPVIHVVSHRGAIGHPEGCGQLWAGTMEHFNGLSKQKLTPHDSILTLDGSDGVPLHLNWLNLMIEEHSRTLASGKLISGSPYNLWDCPLHVNPNAIFHLSILDRCPSLRTIPKPNGTLFTHFDIYHRRAMLNNASLSSLVRTDWHGAGNSMSLELIRDRSSEAIWLHGYKDESLYEIARQHLFNHGPVNLNLKRYRLPDLDMAETCRKWPQKINRDSIQS